jgi:carbon monoxide dehydrogenase subunit G
MELRHEYALAAPADAVWAALDDIEGVAPLVPGFTLERIEGDTVFGTVKVKLGAVTVSYNAEIDIVERQRDARRIVLAVSGRERRGAGSMQANVSAALRPDGATTNLELVTDMQLTGRVAQLGASVIGDVSSSLLAQFVSSLEAHIAGADGDEPPAPAEPAAIDMGAVATRAVAKRLAPIAIAALIVAAVLYLLGRDR